MAAVCGSNAQLSLTSSLSVVFVGSPLGFLVDLPDGLALLVSPSAVFTRLRICGKSGSGLRKPLTPCLNTMLRTLPSLTRGG